MMISGARNHHAEWRPTTASSSQAKRFAEVGAPSQDGNQLGREHVTSRIRMEDGDKSRLGDRRIESSRNVHREKIESGGGEDYKGEVKKQTTDHGGAVDKREISQVRAECRGGGDAAELDSRKAGISKFRNTRKYEGHELSEEEQRTNENLQDDAKGRSRMLQEAVLQGVRQAQLLQQQLQPQQAPIVLWERFLPMRQLRVLLVEDDDSTRHVVSALLRNCSYEVTSASNGLLAWELLEDQTNHVDLVLTEVVMPCLSGIGLLSRIMGHQACKHIPVVMMSSHDSMGIVFKCLSKGAVDFLVKPVRKNELKNLWQHVWRRCHSSSGSGSGSGSASQTQKVAQPKSVAGCNNSGSNDESDNASSGLNARGGSDNGSGTQSSWTKRAVKVQSPQQRANWDLARLNVGSISDVPQQLCGDWVKRGVFASASHDKKGFDNAMGQDLEIATPKLAAVELTFFNEEGPQNLVCAVQDNAPIVSIGEGEWMEEDSGVGGSQENSRKAMDLIGAIACKDKGSEEEQGDSGDREDTLEKHASNSPNSKDKTISDSNSPPLLELALKRPRQIGEEYGKRDDRRVLRHSCSSAFSRYNTSGNHTALPSNGTSPINTYSEFAGYGGHPFIQGSGVDQTCVPLPTPIERVSSSNEGNVDVPTRLSLLSQISHGTNKQDSSSPAACSSGQECLTVPVLVKEEAMPLSPIAGPVMHVPIPLPPGVPAAYGPMHPPMFYSHPAAPHQGSAAPRVADRGEANDCRGSNVHSQAHPVHPQTHHHSHHHSHHHHLHIQHHCHRHYQHLPQQRHLTPRQDEQTASNVAGAPRCGSSNMMNGPEGHNGQSGSSNEYGSNGNGNGSVNVSVTGSNNGSNGHNGHSNGQSAVALAAGGNGERGNQLGNSGSGTGNGATVGSRVVVDPDQNRFARREAALTKFRQKRKERCFEKKVRYQSRKRLAEQRPRVRGQFVRQSVYEATAGELE